MRLGIIQGRLSQPLNGFQECPTNWEEEFLLLKKLDLDHIEWIVTDNFLDNPVFRNNVSSYNISSICADFFVSELFSDKTTLESYLIKTCKTSVKNNIECITIPLLENSSVDKGRDRLAFMDFIATIAKSFPTLKFSFETELDPSDLLDIVSISDNFFITYDTGNITSSGFNHFHYLHEVHQKINNVHLKDRTFDAHTVSPSLGDTDFSTIFRTLKSLNYQGLYTIQTARGIQGLETETISKHKAYFRKVYNES